MFICPHCKAQLDRVYVTVKRYIRYEAEVDTLNNPGQMDLVLDEAEKDYVGAEVTGIECPKCWRALSDLDGTNSPFGAVYESNSDTEVGQ